jgi:hypothetical protein
MTDTVCLVHVDTDGLVQVAQDFSHEDFTSRPDYVFHSGLDTLLELFDDHGIRSTFFVIGKDLRDPAKVARLRSVVAEGHEIGNHSTTHPRYFKRLSPSKKREEIETCHKLAEDRLGVSPRGFRAPAYSISGDTLEILTELGYLYDSSVLPSFYDSIISFLLKQGKKGNNDLGLTHDPFSFDQLRRRNRIYRPSLEDVYRPGNCKIWELPVTCIPYLKLPFHASYVLNSSPFLFRVADLLLKTFRGPITYLIHLKDVAPDLEDQDLQKLSVNPMSPRRQPQRIEIMRWVLRNLKDYNFAVTNPYIERLNEGN